MNGISPQFGSQFRFQLGNRPGELPLEKMELATISLGKGVATGTINASKTEGTLRCDDANDQKVLAWLNQQGVADVWQRVAPAPAKATGSSQSPDLTKTDYWHKLITDMYGNG